MKLKGSSKNLSAKKIIAAFSVMGIAFFAVRIYQSLHLINEDGFFTDKSHITVKLFVVLAAAITLITPALLYLSPLSKAEYIEPKRHVIHGVFCILTGAGAAYNSYALFTSSAERTKVSVAVMILGAVSGVILTADGLGFFVNGRLVNKLKILNLIPVLWAMGLTVSNFSITTSYLNNTVLLIDIFADAFLMLLFFQYAKKFAGIYGDGNSPIFIYSALMCALLELTAFAQANLGSASLIDRPYRLAAAAFSVSALAVMLKNRVPDYVPVSDEEEITTTPFKLAPEDVAAKEEAPAASEGHLNEAEAEAGQDDEA